MFKAIAAAVAGLALCLPAQARFEEGTKPLIDLIGNSGIAVRYNTADCASGKFLGLYRHRGMQRAFILCPGSTVDANDHMVVRHEAIHAIQHCVNAARGTHVFTPIIDNDTQLMEFVYEHLSSEFVEEIKRVYPVEQWRIEFEAFAGMHAFTSDELAEMFTQACLYTEA